MKTKFEETHKTLLVMAAEALGLEAALSEWLAAQYAVAASERLADLEGEPRVKALRAFIHDAALLRRGDQNAERLKIERERLSLARQESLSKFKRSVIRGLEAMNTYLKQHPEAKEHSPHSSIQSGTPSTLTNKRCGRKNSNLTWAPQNPTQSDHEGNSNRENRPLAAPHPAGTESSPR